MGELLVIPVIFLAQTLVSFLCARLVSRLFGFRKRQRDFVVAMGVFGNSNSLPISLVVSLANTISGLHWDRIPGDNDSEVAARGILYLMIFQQLGQLLRWTWGFKVLLLPAYSYTPEEGGPPSLTDSPYCDEPEQEVENGPYFDLPRGAAQEGDPVEAIEESRNGVVERRRRSRADTKHSTRSIPVVAPMPTTPILERHSRPNGYHENNTEPIPETNEQYKDPSERPSLVKRTTEYGQAQAAKLGSFGHRVFSPLFEALPKPVQRTLSFLWHHTSRFCLGVWEFMNPPLWAILASLIVASIPELQAFFFTKETFVYNTFTHAVSQSAGVAVPLIIVVLGANLARSTSGDDDEDITSSERRLERKLLIASLISRMLLPFLVMAPLLALAAKYVPVSILDDPIFIIVCFLLTGAPSALQLAQMCQLNDVYMGAVGKMLVQSYVVWLLPSTLVLVTCGLEVVEWAAAG